jgi:hypothetical protein
MGIPLSQAPGRRSRYLRRIVAAWIWYLRRIVAAWICMPVASRFPSATSERKTFGSGRPLGGVNSVTSPSNVLAKWSVFTFAMGFCSPLSARSKVAASRTWRRPGERGARGCQPFRDCTPSNYESLAEPKCWDLAASQAGVNRGGAHPQDVAQLLDSVGSCPPAS